MNALRAIAAVALALVLQSVIAQATGTVRLPFDLPVVSVVVVALLYGRVYGLLLGSLAGLAQDALAPGVMGIGGLAASLAGFLSGWAGTQFIVTQSLPRFLLFIGGTAVHGLASMGLYSVLGLRTFDQPLLDLTLLGLANAAIGVVWFWAIEILPSVPERWRIRRERRRKVRYH